MRSRSPYSTIRVVASLVIVAMLLLFPASRAHDIGTHFRNPEIRRSTARHTFVAHSLDNTREQLAQNNLQPVVFAPIVTDRQPASLENFDAVPQMPLARLLSRLKLNPAGSGGSDPLL